MATTLARAERAALADLFDVVGPQAPTLCDGWATRDLLAHLLVREGDPLGAPGIMLPPLAGLTERRMNRTLADGSWTAAVDRWRQGPPRWAPARLGRVDEAMNGMEYFIHHEDVRRGGDEPAEPRALPVAHEEALWKRALLVGRLAMRRCPVGVVLENALDPEETVWVRSGSPSVTITGKPSEILLWLTGRRRVAQVELIGDPDAVATLEGVAGRL